MTITQVGTGTGANSAYGTGFTVAAPGTLVPNDVVVVAIATELATAHSFSASGFTQILNQIQTGNNTTALHIFIGSGFTGSGGFAFTGTGIASGDWTIRTCTAWRGASPTNYVLGAVAAQTNNPDDIVVPAVTTTVAGAELLCIGAQTFNSGPRTYTPTMTTQVHNNACYQASKTISGTGTTGTTTVTNAAVQEYVSALFVHLALQEPVDPPLTLAGHWGLNAGLS